MNAQTYSSLWKQVRDAENDDLPQTAQAVLEKIVAKAEAEKAYGQLLKAQLQQGYHACQVAPDSLAPFVEQMKECEQQAADDGVLRAVYQAVLGYLYTENSWLDELHHQDIGRQYYAQALADPALLAAYKATDLDPFVIKGSDSRFFDDDLLSVVAYMAGRFDVLRDYYNQSGNRRGALIATLQQLRQERPDGVEALNKSRYIQRLDSLADLYGDLVECGEVAVERSDFMFDHTDATAEQKWQYINVALDRWGSWPRLNQLRNQQRMLSTAAYHVELERRVTIPQRPQTVELTGLCNITELTMRIYKVNADGSVADDPSTTAGYRALKNLLTPLPELTQSRKYLGKRPYEHFDDSLALPPLPVGVYMLEFESQPQSQRATRCLYFVSDVRVMAIGQPVKGRRQADREGLERWRLVVVSATTGQPLPGARLTVGTGPSYKRKFTTLTADANGECSFEYKNDGHGYGSGSLLLRPRTPDDVACPDMNTWGGYTFNDYTQYSRNVAVFTDRAIYRPGQTVHVAAVCSETDDGRNHRTVGGRKLTFKMLDANRKEVARQVVATDDYGTAAADLLLPAQGLNGTFTVYADYTARTIRVEDYKRPTFEVDIPRVAQDYEDGDTVVARGVARSYAGVPVQGAAVKYRVERRRAFWWLSYSRYWGYGSLGAGEDSELLAEGHTVTADDGSFTVDMPMELPKTLRPMFYNFVLTAEVTDQGGETHQGELSLPLGNRKTAFSATLPDRVCLEHQPKVAFHLQNAAGVDLEARVRYRFDNGRWQDVATNSLVTLPQLRSGRHTLHAVCQGDTLEQTFVAFSLDDSRPATDVRSWFYTSSAAFPLDGGAVTVQAGSSDRQVHVVYTVVSGDTLLESGFADLSNELINRKLTYREDYGDGVMLNFAWVKDGETYSYHTLVERPKPDMHLDLHWATFRNRLVPGQQEEWTLTVRRPDGTPAPAQLMATLYDKSLDQLMPHQWSLVPSYTLWLPSARWMLPSTLAASLYGQRAQNFLNVPDLRYNRFDTDVFPSRALRFNHRRMLMRSAMNGTAVYAVEEAVMADAAEAAPAMEPMAATARQKTAAATGADGEAADAEEEAGGSAAAGSEAPVQMRENLDETAFFLPALVADTTGTVSLKFTLPESLTTWRFMGLAHTRDMMYGQLTDEAVAKKELMIQPNMPRFIRQDDRGTITARIINTTDRPLSATARLQLLDPETERVIAEQQKAVTVADSATVGVTFDVSPAADGLDAYTMVVARVSVATSTASDGEQHYLPLLPSTERVTVTVPFTQVGPGTRTVDLASLVPATALTTGLPPTLTVEYTNNPAWMMIQALPAVGHPHDDCAFCQVASLYANTLGSHLLAQNPQAKTVFHQWSTEQGAETSLMSSLEKDQSLKELVLSETPWVMDAAREQQQKQLLGAFFTPNTISQRLADATAKLSKLQNSDGSWSWWPGMDGSDMLTAQVIETLVRLNHMAGDQADTRRMLKNGFDYMGRRMVALVKEMREAERRGVPVAFPGHTALQWLYACAIDGRKLPSGVTDANAYLKNLLKKESKSQLLYTKALAAIVLQNKSYVKSLKEYTVYREDMGRYYDTPRAGYSWRSYGIPTQVAAIEAMKMLTPHDTVTIAEMQRWLLQSKRTQAWDTPLNTVDAIYAFLDGNSQALAPQPRAALTVDGTPLPTSEATAGLGFVKTELPATGAKVLAVEKTSSGTSWGAVYAQFQQRTTDVAAQQSGLAVKRELLVDGRPLAEAAAPLAVGTRVTVRLTVEAERDYDFVQLVDRRAACMEPVSQLSGYNWRAGYYCTPRDNATNYYFNRLAKGRHIVETDYYLDREGAYLTGTCVVQCAYAPEFRALAPSLTLTVAPRPAAQ